mgnify:CR=1
MKLGSFKRINTTDYPEDNQELIETLGRQLNDGIEQVYFTLNGKLTFDDNFAATVKDVEVTVGANGNPINRTSVVLNTTNIVKGTLVVSAVNVSNKGVFPTGAPFVSFTQSGGLLFIDNVTNLQPNNRYIIRLIALN